MTNLRFLFLILLFVSAFSCSRSRTAATLDDVETYIQERPDSALATIRAIDTTTLTTRSLKAHYALLNAMALDKNWIDTTDVGVVMPAVEYYARHGSAEQKMKAYYYLGRIQENGNDMTAAAVSYTVAESLFSLSEDDRTKGLVSMSMANIYRITHNVDKTLEYTEKGKEFFASSGDTARLNLIYGRQAMAYQEKQEWRTADSLYREGIRLAERDTGYALIYISQYAVTKVVQPDPDPEGAIELLRHKKTDYGAPLSVKDYGVYALASAQSGDNATCEAVLEMLGRLPESRRVESRYFEYRIAELRGDYEAATGILKTIYSDQDTLVYRLLNHSVEAGLRDYFERQARESEERMKQNRLIWLLSLVAIAAVFCAVASWLTMRRRRDIATAENMLRMSEEANRLLSLSNESLESDIGKLRNAFVEFYRQSLERIGSLCEAYVKAKERPDEGKKEAVYRRVERIVEDINKDEESFALFETQVNRYLDDVVEHLLSDLKRYGKVSDIDERFVCYSIVGFDSNTISMLLGLSLSNVYTRRSRLRERIRQMDSPYKEQYLKYFS